MRFLACAILTLLAFAGCDNSTTPIPEQSVEVRYADIDAEQINGDFIAEGSEAQARWQGDGSLQITATGPDNEILVIRLLSRIDGSTILCAPEMLASDCSFRAALSAHGIELRGHSGSIDFNRASESHLRGRYNVIVYDSHHRVRIHGRFDLRVD